MITKQKGCHDIYGIEAKKWQYVNTVIDALMEKYNYKFIRTPIFEATELFARGVGDTTVGAIVNDNIVPLSYALKIMIL